MQVFLVFYCEIDMYICRHGCMYSFTALVLVCVDVMLMSSA